MSLKCALLPRHHTPLIHSVTDLVWRKNKEILVTVYSIPSICKIQTFNNVNRQILKEKNKVI